MKLMARSKERFPSLAKRGCPWHEDCTPMDCEFFRAVPSLDQYARGEVHSVNPPSTKPVSKTVPSVPVKKKGGKR